MENLSSYIISKNNLINNALYIKQKLKNNCKLCAMVKADGYGHKIEFVCEALKNTVDFFGVANAFEAEKIRKCKIKNPIIIVSIPCVVDVEWCANNDVSVCVASLEELLEILKHKFKKPLKIHLKLNTGLNRIGFRNKSDIIDALQIINSNKNLILEGVFTHFATKSHDEKFINKQAKKFKILSDFVKRNSNNKCIIMHCCNSYAALHKSKYHFDMVRCGFALYGYQDVVDENLKPVSEIKSKLVFVGKVNKNETIGYDRTFKCEKNSKIAVVPMGYADGFDRRLSNNFEVLVNGKKAKVVGNVCMDVFMVDVSNIPNVKVGDVVTILGKDGDSEITLSDYAKALNTSEYEIMLKFRYLRMNYVIK